MSAAFYWVLNMSIAASVAGGVILLLRSVRPLPRKFLYPLWIAVLMRLCVPFGISGQFSILHFVTHRSIQIFTEPFEMTCTNFAQAADHYFPLTFSDPMAAQIIRIASIVWLMVCVTLLATTVVCYAAAIHESRHAVHLCEDIYLSDRVNSPVVYGILRPRILLPNGINALELDLILLHERTHIRRADNLWRLLALIAACIHWFNPLVWVFLRCVHIDAELSCDEAVLRRLPPQHRPHYAHTLLSSAARSAALASPFGYGTTYRIHAILSYRRIGTAATIFLAICVCCIAAALLTNPH
jgi:beta-lactamase regulating signal transducer with metallopeptidase domain